MALLAWACFVMQVVLGIPFGNVPAPDWVIYAIAGFFGVLFPLFFLSLRLVTEVRGDVLKVRFAPLWPRRIHMHEIESCEARIYKPIREYGGWGIRWTPWAGRAYNVRGNRGVQIVLRNGKRLLIGTKRSAELERAILSRIEQRS